MISVAMATYNGEKYIEEQIKSILNQSMPVDELIISDDGSTDRTCEIVEAIDDKRVKLFKNNSNSGYIENFRNAISKTCGDVIFLADQDDRWSFTKVEECLKLLDKENALAVCSNFNLIDQDGKIIEDRNDFQMDPFIKSVKKDVSRITTLRLSFGNIAQGCTYCFRREVKDIFLKVHNSEVIHDLQIILIASIMGRVYFLNKPLIDYRIHGNNAVGFARSNRKIEIKTKVSREPFMYRFFRQVNDYIKVPNLIFYKMLYYLRIPYLRAVVRRLVLGE